MFLIDTFDTIQEFINALIQGEECTSYNPWYDNDMNDDIWLNKETFFKDYQTYTSGRVGPSGRVHFWRAIYKIFGKDNVQLKRGEFKLPPLDIAQKMWDKYNGFKQQGKTR